ncbi:MAG: hypothetical protein NZ930_06670 [Candidatus Bipolaricaulota bacterium]|nr:hypothetical protein [Candidatus Bipolaricaulota bacterium]MDW8031746.1 hypothetical protein [Candidatus Bipolaricaulota bacterium]
MKDQRRVVTLALLGLAVFTVSSCDLYVPQTISLWADVHPQGWVVFTGSRPPFPPPPKPQDLTNKILLFHPALGMTITLLQDPFEDFSWPRWSTDALYWIGNSRTVYRLPVSFDNIERWIYDPSALLQAKPLSLQAAERLWADFKGSIRALAPSPDGRYLAFLRETEKRFTIAVIDLVQNPPQEIAELPTAWLPCIIWTPDSRAILFARQYPKRTITLPFVDGQKTYPLGTIMRYELATAEETPLARDIVFFTSPPQDSYDESVLGPGPIALSSDGQILYYTNFVTLSPRTAQDLRVGLYKVELPHGMRQLLVELPTPGIVYEIVVSPSSQRLAFTLVSYHIGIGFSLQSSLYLATGDSTRQLAYQTNGWLFPLWLDDSHLAYVQFQLEMKDEKPPLGVQPALWVYSVETNERSNYLPLLTTQMQLDALRQAVHQLAERVQKLEQALQELQNKDK